MPLALFFTSTFASGWILPVATTERARSPRSTEASFEGSMVLFGRSAAVTPYPAPINTTPIMDPMMILRRRFRPCFPFPLPTPLFDMLGLQPQYWPLMSYAPGHREMFPAGLDVGICGIVPKPQATAGGPR